MGVCGGVRGCAGGVGFSPPLRAGRRGEGGRNGGREEGRGGGTVSLASTGNVSVPPHCAHRPKTEGRDGPTSTGRRDGAPTPVHTSTQQRDGAPLPSTHVPWGLQSIVLPCSGGEGGGVGGRGIAQSEGFGGGGGSRMGPTTGGATPRFWTPTTPPTNCWLEAPWGGGGALEGGGSGRANGGGYRRAGGGGAPGGSVGEGGSKWGNLASNCWPKAPWGGGGGGGQG